MQRVQKQSLDALDGKGVIKIFPSILVSEHTALVLKEPKTKTSIRRVFLPKTVAEMLVERRKQQEELKELFGDEYTDYGLVFCSSMGTPIEGQVINRTLNKLITEVLGIITAVISIFIIILTIWNKDEIKILSLILKARKALFNRQANLRRYSAEKVEYAVRQKESAEEKLALIEEKLRAARRELHQESAKLDRFSADISILQS